MTTELQTSLMRIDPENGRVQRFSLPAGLWQKGVVVWCKLGKLALSSTPQTRSNWGGLVPAMPSLLEAGEITVHRVFFCPPSAVITAVIVEASDGFTATITKMGSRAEQEY